AAEGIDEKHVEFVGNVMIDTLRHQLPKARELNVPGRLGVEKAGYAVATLHRPSNVDDPSALSAVLDALARVADEMPVIFPLHPRTRRDANSFGVEQQLKKL